MPLNPLTDAAESLAPAQVNGTRYLDPNPGRDIIARYGNARAIGAGLEEALKLSDMANRTRLNRMQAQEYEAGAGLRERERAMQGMRFDQEEQDLLDRKEFTLVEGELARDLWSLDPESPTYEQDYRRALSILPESAKESPSISAALDYHKLNIGERTKMNTWRQQEAERQNHTALRASLSAIRAAGGMELNADEQEAYRRKHTAQDGTLDTEGFIADIMAKGRGKERVAEGEKFKTEEGIRQGNRLELMGVKSTAEAQEKQTKQALGELDAVPRAFPTQKDSVVKAWAASQLGLDRMATDDELKALIKSDHPGKSLEDIEKMVAKELPTDYAQAQEFDKNREAREKEAARSRSMDEYVNLVPGLDDRGKQARRNFWRAATENWDTPASATDVPPDGEVAPDTTTPKKLTDDVIDSYLMQAGGDPVKALQMAKDDGYSE